MQYIYDSVSAVATQQVVEAQPSSQTEDIKDELGVIFEAHGKTIKDEANKVDKIKLLELSAEEVIKMGFFTILTSQKPIAAIPKLDLKIVNFLNELIFAAQRASKSINSVNTDIKFNNLLY